MGRWSSRKARSVLLCAVINILWRCDFSGITDAVAAAAAAAAALAAMDV